MAPLAPAQNLVGGEPSPVTAPALSLSVEEAVRRLKPRPDYSAAPKGPEAARVARKLDRHVAEFVRGFPYQGFHHTLGISGYETCFNHPDQMVYALSTALPYLSSATAAETRRFLTREMAALPPYAEEGWDNRTGAPREAYEVPAELRASGRAPAGSAFGVYAYAEYVRMAGEAPDARRLEAVRKRLRPLLDAEYSFDPRKADYTGDQSQRLNGDLAALSAALRLDLAAEEPRLAERARQLLELRLNLDRLNPALVEKTQSTSKHLHVLKLARYCDLVPELGEALRARTEGCAPARLRALREARNGWYLAFGDRLLGGENYTNPTHFSHALFSGAALVEQAEAGQLLNWVDVPWCRGDFYFMEKCVQALWAAAGRPWKP